MENIHSHSHTLPNASEINNKTQHAAVKHNCFERKVWLHALWVNYGFYHRDCFKCFWLNEIPQSIFACAAKRTIAICNHCYREQMNGSTQIILSTSQIYLSFLFYFISFEILRMVFFGFCFLSFVRQLLKWEFFWGFSFEFCYSWWIKRAEKKWKEKNNFEEIPLYSILYFIYFQMAKDITWISFALKVLQLFSIRASFQPIKRCTHFKWNKKPEICLIKCIMQVCMTSEKILFYFKPWNIEDFWVLGSAIDWVNWKGFKSSLFFLLTYGRIGFL